jgi:hypothetical protein
MSDPRSNIRPSRPLAAGVPAAFEVETVTVGAEVFGFFEKKPMGVLIWYLV